jgi:cysteinyl-tRNA synthetase, unknown class
LRGLPKYAIRTGIQRHLRSLMSRRVLKLWNWLSSRLAGVDPVVRRRAAILTVLGAAAVLAWSYRDLPGNWYEATYTDKRPLARAKSWHYQLQNVDIDKIAQVDADVVVVDYARAGVPLTRAEVAKLKVREGSKPRIVLSYLSVGEAEEKRYYWDQAWTAQPEARPSWVHMNNCAWPGAWAVKFWQDGWKQIVYRGDNSYLRKIIEAGFDGVYLDRVDMFEDFPNIKAVRASARADMIDLVADLAQTARAIEPKFLVLPNNGIELLDDREFRRAIDGIGMEELLYSEKGTGVRNDATKIRASLAHLRKLQWDYKPVFTLEYLITKPAIEAARAELDGLKIIAAFPTRALDGGDPTQPVELAKDPGTPEFVASNCSKANSW